MSRPTERADDRSHVLRRTELALFLLLFVYVVIAAIGLLWSDFGEATMRIRQLRLAPIAGILGLVTLHYLLRIFRWQFLTYSFGLSVPLWTNALFYIAGFSMSLTPGRAGEALRLWYLKRHYGAPFRRTLSLMLGDRLFDLIAMMVLASIGTFFFADYVWGIIALWVLLLCGIGCIAWQRAARFAVRLVYRLAGRRARRLFAKLDLMLRYAGALTRPRLFSTLLLVSIAGWVMETEALYILLRTLGTDISNLGVILAFAISSLAGALTMLPGGLVGTEVALFALLIAQGVSSPIALVATVLIRLATLWYGTVLGLLALAVVIRQPVRP